MGNVNGTWQLTNANIFDIFFNHKEYLKKKKSINLKECMITPFMVEFIHIHAS